MNLDEGEAQALLQKAQALHWQRGQCAPRLFSEQNLAQLSTLRSPGKPDVHGAPLVAAAARAAALPAIAAAVGDGRLADGGRWFPYA